MAAPAISRGFRLALLAKGLLLLAIAALLFALAVKIAIDPAHSLAVRLALPLVLGYFGSFVGWVSRLAFADAALGEALTESGALPLASRRLGYSLQLPSGRFLEYVLWNPWGPLEQGQRYTVTFGRYSGVLVEPPRREPA